MTQIEKVAGMLATGPGQETFLQWAGSEVTQLMLSAAKELARPQPPPYADPSTVALTLGTTLGATTVIEYLTNPFRERTETPVVPGYGAEEILQENGYGND